MRFFWASLKCWFVHGGHCWEFRHLTYCQGKGAVMRCIKCGCETVARSAAIGK